MWLILWFCREDVLTVASVEAEAEAGRTESLSKEEAVIGNVTCKTSLHFVNMAVDQQFSRLHHFFCYFCFFPFFQITISKVKRRTLLIPPREIKCFHTNALSTNTHTHTCILVERCQSEGAATHSALWAVRGSVLCSGAPKVNWHLYSYQPTRHTDRSLPLHEWNKQLMMTVCFSQCSLASLRFKPHNNLCNVVNTRLEGCMRVSLSLSLQ